MQLLYCAEGVICLNKTTVTVSSVTYAIKARKLLQRAKIQSKLVKLNADENKYGCSYGIEFPSSAFFDVVMELNKQEIPYHVLN